MAHEGAIIAGCDVDVEGSEETARLVREVGGAMSSLHPVDRTDEGEVGRWIAGVIDEHGRIDSLYANAAAPCSSPIAETSFEEWSWVLRHELDLDFLPVKRAWLHLQENGGTILLVGSTAGISSTERGRRCSPEPSRPPRTYRAR